MTMLIEEPATIVRFCVFGKPQQRGSKSAVPIGKKGGGYMTAPNGRPLISVKDSNEKSKDWMRMVADKAREVYQGTLLTGDIQLSAVFYFARPKGHYGTGRNSTTLKRNAPEHCNVRKDLAKLVRALEDAITGVVWRDDKQVCAYKDIRRAWAPTSCERTEVEIEELT